MTGVTTENFGFAAHVTGPDGKTLVPYDISLPAPLEKNRRVLIVYGAPAAEIARCVQDGADLPETLAVWRSVAGQYLTACRKMGLRAILFQRPGDTVATQSIAKRLADELDPVALHALRDPGSAVDAFFLSIVTLEVLRDAATCNQMHELEARSISHPSYSTLNAERCARDLLARWRDKTAEARAEAELLGGRITALETAQQAAQDEAAQANARIETLTREGQTLRDGEIRDGKIAVALNVQIDDLEEALKSQTAERDAKIAALTRERDTKVAALTRERDAARRVENEERETGRALASRIDGIEQALKAATAERDAARQAREQHHQTAQDLANQIKAMQQALQTETAAHENRVAELTRERDAARRVENKEREVGRALASRIDALSRQMEDQVAAALAETDQTQKTATVLANQIRELEQALSATQGQYLSAQHHTLELNKAMEVETRRLEGTIAETRRILDTVNSERERLNAENEQLLCQLNAVYASNSWRVTSPVRSISRLVRRLPR